MAVSDELIDLYMEIAWDVVLNDDLTNKKKVRILNTIIHDDIPNIKMFHEAGVWL